MVNFTPIAAFTDATLAAELGISLLNVNQDAVAVFDSDFNQVFQKARPLEAEIIPRARFMDHPVEDGQVNTDYKIIVPLEIILPLMIPAPYYRNTYQEIASLWENSELLSVQSKTASYSNMVISEPPVKETPDRFDVITVHLRMRQIQVVTADGSFAPIDPTDENTQVLGEQSPSLYTFLGTPLGVASTLQTIAAEFF